MSVKRKESEQARFVEHLPDIKGLFLQQQEAVAKFFGLVDFDEVTKLAQKVTCSLATCEISV
jgi:hypothetical protein